MERERDIANILSQGGEKDKGFFLVLPSEERGRDGGGGFN